MPNKHLKLLFLVGDDLYLRGLPKLIISAYCIPVYGFKDNTGQLSLDRDSNPDVLFIDLNHAKIDLKDAVHHITLEYPQIQIFGISLFVSSIIFNEISKARAQGYLKPSIEFRNLIESIKSINKSDLKCKSDAFIEGYSIKITKREMDVLRLLAKGYTALEIGNMLTISLETARTYKKRLIDKFNARNSVELIVKSIREGLICFLYILNSSVPLKGDFF